MILSKHKQLTAAQQVHYKCLVMLIVISDIVMPMYSLQECNDNYSLTLGIL